VIVLGVVLIILGFLLPIPLLYTIGVILLVLGVILWALGSAGHSVAGRRNWF
jgi:hypothetical protein